MQDYTKVLTHEILFRPEHFHLTIGEIPGQYLTTTYKYSNGIVCTHSGNISNRLQDLVKDPEMLNRSQGTILFFHSKSLYHVKTAHTSLGTVVNILCRSL